MNSKIYTDDKLSSSAWLDGCVKHIYYFEKVVLPRALCNSNFTDQEIIDIIGNLSRKCYIHVSKYLLIPVLYVISTLVKLNVYQLIRLGDCS